MFRILGLATGKPITPKRVSRIVSRIGKKAGVVVNKAQGKFASAHDLRRSFGTRWAKRVMPAVLRRLMRHSAIETTMAYYVDLDAYELAADLWRDHAPAASSPHTFPHTTPGGGKGGNLENDRGTPAESTESVSE